jgi:hypothetical protein
MLTPPLCGISDAWRDRSELQISWIRRAHHGRSAVNEVMFWLRAVHCSAYLTAVVKHYEITSLEGRGFRGIPVGTRARN